MKGCVKLDTFTIITIIIIIIIYWKKQVTNLHCESKKTVPLLFLL